MWWEAENIKLDVQFFLFWCFIEKETDEELFGFGGFEGFMLTGPGWHQCEYTHHLCDQYQEGLLPAVVLFGLQAAGRVENMPPEFQQS